MNPNTVGSVESTYPWTLFSRAVPRSSVVWTTGFWPSFLVITFTFSLTFCSKKQLTVAGGISVLCGVYFHLKTAGSESFAQTWFSSTKLFVNRCWESEEKA